MTAQILYGKPVAAKIKNNLKFNGKPTLAVCLIGDDAASRIYILNKQKACEEVGIRTFIQEFPNTVALESILKWVKWCNSSSDIHGILVQLPVPGQFDKNFILQQIEPLKDVDCFHPENQGLLMMGQPRFLPCTPAGVLEIFKFYNIKPKGKHIVIVNRTVVVGQPFTSLLTQDIEWGNATVTVCHEYTKNIQEICQSADIIITAVGKPGYRLTADMVRKEQVIIDIGINRICDEKGKIRIIGDVDFAAVSQIVRAITPVPYGCGLTTVACLLQNTVKAYEGLNL
jgi:methylenetetrahydrofolate dehydrogenase (NADP+)/methenyltetrahydrofolate cyclohydrolase